MRPEQELELLKKENSDLFAQLEEANAILFEKQQEIILLRENTADIAELQSRLDGQLNNLQQMQDTIGKKQRQAEGAEERETELNNELTAAYGLQQKYEELLTEYIYVQTQLKDVQEMTEALKMQNEQLQKRAAKAAELESRLEDAEFETAALRDTIKLLENKNDT